MQERLIEFIKENNLSPFNKFKSQIKTSKSVYQTVDAKSVHKKVLNKISQNFIFNETRNLLSFFSFTDETEKIKERQEFFKIIKSKGKIQNSFLKKLKRPERNWRPKYDVVVVTEDTETYNKLKEKNCPTQLIVSETDVTLLESRDIVQIIDCAEYSLALESLPQSVFLKNIEEAYLERHLEKLSGWQENLQILKENLNESKLKKEISELLEITRLIEDEKSKIITKNEAETEIENINKKINEKLRQLTISGESLIEMLNKGSLPPELKTTVQEAISESSIPSQIIIPTIPVKLDEETLENLIKKQSAQEYTSIAEEIKSNANKIKAIPERLSNLSKKLIYFDFISGISNFIEEEFEFQEIKENFKMENSKNIFLENPQGISFNLSGEFKCSILTGANSGGKTTLIEHIIQIVTLTNIGLPISGKIETPLFTEVYYFAKNKGSMSKGAFETLLSQMSEIKPGKNTLILADEIEAVTEPGVAGNIIAATADFFIKKNCFMVIATHLGHEIKNILPEKTRIDGIEAKGLDENFELIVDHNPVLGRLAHSTPELIVEKMANSEKTEYFTHLHDFLKNNKK